MNETIYRHQYGIILFFIPLVFKTAMLPALISKQAGADAWLTIGFMVLVEFLQLILIYSATKQDAVNIIREKNVWLFRVLFAPYVFVFGIKTVVFIMEIAYYVTTFLFYNVATTTIIIIILITIFYVASRGARSIGRLAVAVIWLLPILLILGVAFGRSNFHVEHLLPIFHDVKSVFFPIGDYVFWMFDFSPLLFVKLAQKETKRVWFVAPASIIAVAGSYMLFTMSYGNAAPIIDCAFARMASFNIVSSELGSIDWPSSIMWLLMAIVTLALKAYAAGEIIKGQKLKRSYAIGGFTVIVGIVILCFVDDVQKAIKLGQSFVRYIVVGIEIIVPVLILVIKKLLTRKMNEA